MKTALFYIPPHNIGGHFLIWSMYYLCKIDRYVSNDGMLVDLPLTLDKNSRVFHHFNVPMAHGYSMIKNFVENTKNPILLYGAQMIYSHAVDDLHYEFNNITDDNLKEISDYIYKDSMRTLDWASEHVPLIFIDYYSTDVLSTFYNDRFPSSALDLIRQSDKYESLEEYESFFFSDSNNFFKDNNIWDKREKLALLAPHILKKINYYTLDKSQKHLYYTSDDIWNGLPTIVYEIADFLSLTINEDRLSSWMHIYNEWRLNHDAFFARHLDRIVDAIVNNYYVSLKRFNLNLYKEVLIQSKLIYEYNLNLKTWQLEKFPDNTQDLHELLEPNTHCLDKVAQEQYNINNNTL
jgi:hypothetical protein